MAHERFWSPGVRAAVATAAGVDTGPSLPAVVVVAPPKIGLGNPCHSASLQREAEHQQKSVQFPDQERAVRAAQRKP